MNTATIAATHTTYDLDGGPGYGPYKAVTAVFKSFGVEDGLLPLHLVPLHELNDSRPQAECGARSRYQLVKVTDEITTRGACEDCQQILTARSA